MEFGRVENHRHLDFRFPPDDVRNSQQPGVSRLFLGAPEWGCKGWIGKVYPSDAKPQDFLRLYSERLSAIEMNSTYYRIPDVSVVRRWADMANPHFRFCPKISKIISHEKLLRQCALETQQFINAIKNLKAQLGVCFLQLHPQFGLRDLEDLREWLDLWDPTVPLVVEFRNPSCFVGPTLHPRIFSLLRDKNVGTVITDVGGRRDVLHMSLTSTSVMIRFVGNDDSVMDQQRLADWTKRLSEWQDSSVQNIYFFVHQIDTLTVPETIDAWLPTISQVFQIKEQSLVRPQRADQLSLF